MKKTLIIFIILFMFVSSSHSAQIVCIDLGTVREGLSDIWDIVSIYEDDVELSGPGYSNSKVIKIEGLTKDEVIQVLNLKVPDFKHVEIDGELVHYWLDENSGKYYRLNIEPKYQFTLEDITQADITVFNSKLSTTVEKINALSKVKHKIPLYTDNLQTIMPK